jgi:hypothetical protein
MARVAKSILRRGPRRSRKKIAVPQSHAVKTRQMRIHSPQYSNIAFIRPLSEPLEKAELNILVVSSAGLANAPPPAIDAEATRHRR